MRALVAACTVVALLAPSLCWADDAAPVLPRWTLKDFENNTYACYDFEGAKALKVFEAECGFAQMSAAQLTLDKADLESAASNLTASNKLLTQANLDLKKIVAQTQDDRDQALHQAASAQADSVFGGGFKWLVGSLVAGLVAGGVLVYAIRH